MRAQAHPTIEPLAIDQDYLLSFMQELLAIPSPTGYTDNIVHRCVEELESLGVRCELTRRGAIRGHVEGRESRPARAIVAHVDTIGAMVTGRKDNGRLRVAPVGTWSARFAEGARCTIFSEAGARRGTILPLKASGHVFDDEVDTQPVSWDNLEIRVDEPCYGKGSLVDLGFHVGDHVAIDPGTEVSENGFVNSRHLDDKAGVAMLFAVIKALRDAKVKPAVDSRILLTISEEVGSGASTVLHGDVAEMVAIDNATPAPGQNSAEFGVTIGMMDSSGPFDFHLTHGLIGLCREFGIPHQRDVFKHYRCDAAAAIEAGNDIRTALACFGIDSSHGYERTHVDSLVSLGRLIALYLQSDPVVARDRVEIGPPADFPTQPEEEAPHAFTAESPEDE